MRRFVGVLAALILLAPAGLKMAAADAGSEALRCAIACGHAATSGAACCPISGAGGKGAEMAACHGGDQQSVAPTLPAQSAILAARLRLAAPQGGFKLTSIFSVTPRGPSPRPPDHVPLFVS